MRLHIIRHGDPDYQNDSLTPRGQQEAEALVSRLAALPLTAIYSSPLGRAKKTAEPTAKNLELPINVLTWAREVELPTVEPGTDLLSKKVVVWNLPPHMLKECEQQEGGWMNAPVLSPPKAALAFDEIRAGWQNLVGQFGVFEKDGHWFTTKKLPASDIALFCHHGLGLALLSVLMEVPATLLWRSMWLAPASVTTVLFEQMGQSQVNLRITSVGDTGHLHKAGLSYNPAGLCYNAR
jgi:broad specificity phosphatase PhoE